MSQYQSKNRYERFRTIGSLVFCVVIAALMLFGKNKWGPKHVLLEEGLVAFGCFCAGIGALGRIWASLYISGYKNTTLVQEGPYSFCRNPLYLFSFIGALGVGAISESFTIPLILCFGFAAYYPLVVRREEQRLEEYFGNTYRNYKQRIPAFLPKWSALRNLKQPESYTVNPRIFFMRIVDALWFIWLIGIIELIEAFHTKGWLPVWFRFY